MSPKGCNLVAFDSGAGTGPGVGSAVWQNALARRSTCILGLVGLGNSRLSVGNRLCGTQQFTEERAIADLPCNGDLPRRCRY